MIVFPQHLDGDVQGIVQTKTESWIEKITEAASWAKSTFKVTLLGPTGVQDNLWQWIIDKNFILARSAVLFNHSRVRHFLDHVVLNNTFEPKFEPDISKLPELAHVMRDLVENMKLKATTISDPLSCTVEQITQIDTDDVAAVRDADQGGAFGYVSVVESTEVDSSTRPTYFETIRNTTSGATKEAVIHRGENPVNEFVDNGANIMRLFRSHFPLMQLDYTGKTTVSSTGSKAPISGGKKVVSRPLQAKGTVTVTDMRHMLLQYPAQIAKELPLIFYLANQTQRHAVLRNTSVRVQHGQEKRFHAMMNDPAFEKRLTDAIADPNTADANQLFRTCVQIFTSVGQSKPWSAHQRRAMLPRMYALADRHAQASIFYTIAVDDTRSAFTVRLSIPSKTNAHFPGFATENARSFWQKEGGDVDPSVQGEMKSMLDALKGEGCIVLEFGGKTDKFTKMHYQRLVVENPVAATQVFELLTQAAKRILFKVDDVSKKTHAKFVCNPGDTFPKMYAPNGLPGIFSVVTADVDVVEENKRGSMHLHGLNWTSLSPALLASLAGNAELWSMAATAIESQFKAEVSAAAHVLYKLHKAAGVLPMRASFTSGVNIPPSLETRTSAEISQDASISTLVLNGHFNHSFTCHKNNSGKKGCRSGYKAGHPVPLTTIHELVCSKEPIPTERLTADAGTPFRCSGPSPSCRRRWTGILDIPLHKMKTPPTDHDEPAVAPRDEEPIHIFLVKPEPKIAHFKRIQMHVDEGGKHPDDGCDDEEGNDNDDNDPTVRLNIIYIFIYLGNICTKTPLLPPQKKNPPPLPLQFSRRFTECLTSRPGT